MPLISLCLSSTLWWIQSVCHKQNTQINHISKFCRFAWMAMETMQTAMHAKKKENEKKNSYYGSGSVHIASSFSPSGGWHIEFLTLCCCCCYNNNDVMLTYSLWSNVNTLPLHCRYTAATLSIPVYEKRIARHFSFCNTGPIRLASIVSDIGEAIWSRTSRMTVLGRCH